MGQVPQWSVEFDLSWRNPHTLPSRVAPVLRMSHTQNMSTESSNTQFTSGLTTFSILGLVGEGSYSYVTKVIDESTKDLLALKVMKNPTPIEARGDATDGDDHDRSTKRVVDFLKLHRHVRASTRRAYYIALSFTAASHSIALRFPS